MSSRGRLFTRLPPLVRVPDLSDAMRLALQWLEMLDVGRCVRRQQRLKDGRGADLENAVSEYCRHFCSG